MRVAGYFDEIGFFESSCTGFEWKNADLEVHFRRGISVGGSDHPLSESLSFESPCVLTFHNVSASRLQVSEYLGEPNSFKRHIFERNGLAPANPGAVQTFYMEGSMNSGPAQGWFVWDLSAEECVLDDLKDPA